MLAAFREPPRFEARNPAESIGLEASASNPAARALAFGVLFETVPERIAEWIRKQKPQALTDARDGLVRAFVPSVVAGLPPLRPERPPTVARGILERHG